MTPILKGELLMDSAYPDVSPDISMSYILPHMLGAGSLGVGRSPGLLQFADDIDCQHCVFGKDQYSTAVNFHDSSLALCDSWGS